MDWGMSDFVGDGSLNALWRASCTSAVPGVTTTHPGVLDRLDRGPHLPPPRFLPALPVSARTCVEAIAPSAYGGRLPRPEFFSLRAAEEPFVSVFPASAPEIGPTSHILPAHERLQQRQRPPRPTFRRGLPVLD